MIYIIFHLLFHLGLMKLRFDRVNLGSGPNHLAGYYNIDITRDADMPIDLEKWLLPFLDGTLSAVVCISVINYFSRERAQEIVNDIYRALKPGGVARFGTQDLGLIAQKYVDRDRSFFFQKLPDGRDRFPGVTMADKINAWFYGYPTANGKHCKYVYDYESLEEIFKEAGFLRVERKQYLESILPDVEKIDNRPDQMFFLEAIK